MTRTLAVLALLTTAPAALAQNPTAELKQTLLGNGPVAMTRTLGDLDASWRQVKLGLPADQTDMRQMVFQMFAGGGPGVGVYFTQGNTVTLAGHDYLVTYEVPTKPINYRELAASSGSGLPDALKPDPLTAATVLNLALVDLRSVNKISEIRPFSLTELTAKPALELGDVGADSESVNNLKQIGLGIVQYCQDYDEKFPPMSGPGALQDAIMPYVKTASVFLDPHNHQPYTVNSTVSHRTLAEVSAPATLVVVYETALSGTGTRAALFADGHVKRISASDWARVWKESQAQFPPKKPAAKPKSVKKQAGVK